jgi:hypothetical protein
MASSSVSSILEGLASAGKAFEKDEAGSREALIDHGRALVAALEIPSEFLQRTFWAEVGLSSDAVTCCESLAEPP